MYAHILRQTLLVLVAFSLQGSDLGLSAIVTLSDDARDAIETGQRHARVLRLQQDARQRPAPVLSFEIGQLIASHAAAFLGQAVYLTNPDSRRKCFRLLAQSALASGSSADALNHATRFSGMAESEVERSFAQYTMARSEMLAGMLKESYTRMDWLSRHGHGDWRGWGLYGQGQCALAEGDTTEALRVLKSVTALHDHAAVAPAMLMLGQLYEAQGNTPRAIRYLTIYREKYKHGIIPLLDHVSDVSSQAEILAGVTYTVQVGVFGERSNAIKQKDLFESMGHRVRLKRKTVAGQRYTAVWVGQYRSQSSALKARRTLETKMGETFRVVIVE